VASHQKKNDSRVLKKKGGTKKPKSAGSAKSAVSAPPASGVVAESSASPSASPPFPSTQIFYNDELTTLSELNVAATGWCDDANGSLAYIIDLGVVKGDPSGTDTMGVVMTSFTTSINLDMDGGDDDDQVDVDVETEIFLEILAFSGCDSAASCEAASVTPSSLVPSSIEMMGWYRDIDFDNSCADAVIDWQDTITSTNEANFLLAGKGSGDFFLQAKINIDSITHTHSYIKSIVHVVVSNWVVVVENEADSLVTKSVGHVVPTASP